MIAFKPPFRICCSGPSQCGKTQWTLKLLKHANRMFDKPFDRIVWCYGEAQALRGLPNNVEVIRGVPDVAELRKGQAKLVIIDDLMQEMDDSMTALFTRGSHHLDVSIVYLTQNIFYKGQRTMRLSCTHLVLFKNPSDKLQIANLGRQLYPRASKHFVEAFQDATKKPHSYLLVDLTQEADDKLRLRTNIFPDELCTVYVIRSKV